MSSICPDFESFERGYESGRGQVLWLQAPADLDTPVSLLLKLAQAGPESFLLESVTGAEARGRYSIIGWKPDLIWRCRGDRAEINRSAAYDAHAFQPEKPGVGALASLRALLEESALDLPEDLPSSAAGLFGYFGYDMIRLVEKLPEPNPDPLDLPDALMLRPSVVAVIDNAFDTVTLVAPARPVDGVSAREAYGRAAERLRDAFADLDRPIPNARDVAGRDGTAKIAPKSNTPKSKYKKMVAAAKEYIAAGDIFQVVPSQRWRFPFKPPALALYRALRRTNPSPYMFFFNFSCGGEPFQIAGASPEILVAVSEERDRPK